MTESSNVIKLFERIVRKHNFVPRLEEHLNSTRTQNTKRISMKHFTSIERNDERRSKIYGKSHSLAINPLGYQPYSDEDILITDFATVLCDENQRPLFRDEELLAQILLAQIKHFDTKCREQGYDPIFSSQSGFFFYFDNDSAIIPFGGEYIECYLRDGELERQRARLENSDYIIIDEGGIQRFSS